MELSFVHAVLPVEVVNPLRVVAPILEVLTDAEGDTLGVTDKDAAGIKQVDSLQVTVLSLRVWRCEDSWYDLQGRKVKGHPVKGLYIKNGTKCVIN